MLRRTRRLFAIYAAYHLPDATTFPRLARLALLPSFLKAGLRALPAALRWVRHRDPAARARVKQILDLSGPAPLALDPGLLRPASAPPAPPPGAALTLVIPVYGNLPLLRQVLARVAAHTDLPWRAVLVDDASPDPGTLPFLRDWAARHPAQLIELSRNEGFVGAVNHGLAAAEAWPGDPVVLLNSDALLPPGWAPRLLRPLWEDVRVASVTPLSNDAELGSVPEPGRAGSIAPEAALAVDAVARGLNGAARVTAPAGVGFCMALAPRALAQEPRFDAVFAPGYGEEVDWCQKTRAMGFTHAYVPDLFVAHVGGQSFGDARKRALIARNAARITRRYPRFDAEVHGVLRRDPLVTARLALGLAQVEAERRGPLPIYLAHAMGGGAETDLQRRLRADLAACGAAVVLRVGGVFRVTVELWRPRPDGSPGMTAAGTGDWTLVTRLLAPVTTRRLVYACAVGDPDPVALPALFTAQRGPGDGLEVLIHDYFPLSPTPSLLEAGDRWAGVPDPATASARHGTRRPDGTPVPLAQWRNAWGGLLRAADRVTCFSQAATALVAQVYPDVPLTVAPHALPVPVPALPRPTHGRCVLGLLGNLAPHKGAGVAAALSRHPGGDLVLLGGLDPAYRLNRRAVHHGAYTVAELPRLAAYYGISCWCIPSLWPETFSFTTHEALATGLPVLVFDLGAQAEAVRTALVRGAPGAVLPLAQAGDPAAIWAAAQHLSTLPSARHVA